MNVPSTLARTALLAPVVALAVSVHAAQTDLSTVPLSTYFAPSSVDVKPNILFVLDDSGSMDWDAMPDQATWFDDYNSQYRPGNYANVDNYMPPYMRYSAAFNGLAYNPAIRYQPPLKFRANNTLDTTTYPSMNAAATSNWTAVKRDGYGVQSTGTSDLSGGVFAYVVQPGLYCNKADLRSCNAQTAKSTAYPEPAAMRWCKTARLDTGTVGDCRANWDAAYTYPSMPAPRIATLTISGSGTTRVDGLTVNSVQIMNGATTDQISNQNLANAIAARINACTNTKPSPTSPCGTVGYSATVSSSGSWPSVVWNVTIYAPDDSSFTPAVAKTPAGSGMSVAATAFARSSVPLPYWRNTGVTPSASNNPVPGENWRHTITPSVDSYPYPGDTPKIKRPGRTDCAGDTCTYAEEMTNYANWYSYYRTRMQVMKTAASRAFAGIDSAADIAAGVSRFRVGLMSINNNQGNKFLNLGEFAGQQRADWYTMLFSAYPNDATPLREALANAGRLYAGKLTSLNDVTVVDPMQFSCQQNFCILSTDGFWNRGAGFKLDGTTAVGNEDGSMPRPFNDGGIAQTQARTSTLWQRTETQRAEKGTLEAATAQIQTRTSRLQKRTNGLLTRTRASSTASWTAWTPVPAGSTCQWDTNYPNRRECAYAGWSGYIDESTSCTPNALDTSTSNNSVWEVGVGCQYYPSTWTDWEDTGSCSAAPKDTTGPWTTPVARECQTVTGTYVGAATCSPTTPDANGQSTVCRYTFGGNLATQTCAPAYVAGDYSNPVVYRNCGVSSPGWNGVPAGSTCTVTDWSDFGTRTNCQYSGWGNWVTGTCTPVEQSTGPTYTVTTARECQTVSQAGTGYSDTLADVAAYYYNRDLRRPASDNPPAVDATGTCTGPVMAPGGSNEDLCENNVPKTSDDDVVAYQHMTTFTLGLGAQGKMLFSPTYRTDTSGDFASVAYGVTADPNNGVCQWQTSGTCVWPRPSSDDPANIDDLWHAAVNGRGSYFSATDPGTLSKGLGDILKTIVDTPRPGTAAAAASSNPNISAGDNYVFSSYYKTVDWYGDLYRQRFDITTKALTPFLDWSAKTLLDCATTQWTANKIYVYGDAYRNGNVCYIVTTSDGYVSGASFGATDTANTAVVTNQVAGCSSSWAATTNYVVGNAYSQGGVCYYVVKDYTSLSTFGATDLANVNASYVAGSPTSRTIYTKGSGTARIDFTYSAMSTAQQAYFEKAHIAYNPTAASTPVNLDGLSQFCYPPGGSCLSATAQDNNTIATGGAAGQALVNYLRGDRSNEVTYFRARKHVLGDIVSSEARYVKAPLFSYTDANYSGFKTLMSSRRGMVYVASNDGMLHAFDSETGQELWAYVPGFVLPDLYKLADKEYSQHHQFYVDGTPEVADICDKTPPATCLASEWKTILVGGLNRGGKGFYALDITNPADPKVLWEFTDTNMGYTYGNPRITKLKSGVWVVVLTSGYNNADGKGYLYVLKANNPTASSGAPDQIVTIPTGVGAPAAPSGLARIAAHAPSSETDNTTLAVYGGDLLGNLWRFDVNNDIGAAGYDAHRMVTFLDSSGVAQPVTAKPVVATIDNYPVVYVGTGKYLGLCDINNKRCVYDVVTGDDVKETMYAVKDNSGTTTYANPQLSTSGFVRQELVDATCGTSEAAVGSCTPGEKIRKIDPTNPVSWGSQNGWYVNFLSVGERANTDPSLALGSLVFTTNNPNIASAAPCGEPGADTTASWLYTLDARTGGAVLGSAGVAASSLGNVIATRPVLIRTPDGTVYALIRTSGGNASNGGGGQPGAASGSGFFPGSNEGGSSTVKKPPINLSGGGARRVTWREILNN